MKILTLKSDFSGIKTVVFYRWSTFIPTNPEIISSDDKANLLSDHSSKEVYYYSGGDSSDYLTFSEYGFKFNPEKDKFQSFIKPNYFDKKILTRTLINDDGSPRDFYNSEVLSLFDNCIFPGLSNEESSEDDENLPNFFGIITHNDQNLLLLDIPENVWKVELYGDFIYSNNSHPKYKESFVSYELLHLLYPEYILETPTCIITMGPEIDDLNNLNLYQDSSLGEKSYSMYYKGDLDYYLSSVDVVKSDELLWNSLYREITSRKVLQLIISPEGSLENVINISYLAWLKSKNPNRNQKDYSLRNDEFWATRDYFDNRTNNISTEFFQDPVSGTLFGTQKLDSELNPLPILNSKIDGIGKRFFKRRAYKVGEVTLIDDYIYASISSSRIELNSDPRYSHSWMILKNYEQGDENRYLGISENSLELLNKGLRNDYYQAYVHLNNKDYGSIEPSGYLSYRKLENTLRKFKIIPSAGYTLDTVYLYVDGKRFEETSEVTPQNDYFIYTLQSTFINSVDNLIEISVSFKKKQNNISLKVISLIDKKDSFESFIDSFTKSLSKLTDLSAPIDEGGLGIDINFYDSEENLLEPKLSEEDLSGKDIIEFDNVKFPIYLKLDDIESPYRLVEVGKVLSTNESVPLSIEHPDNIPNKFLIEFSNENEPIELYFKVTAKKFNCQVSSDPGVDLSSEGQYVLYGDPFEFKFTPQITKEITSVEITYGTDEKILNRLNDEVISITIGSGQSSTEIGEISKKDSIYTLRIESVLKELTIYIKCKNKK